MTTSTAEEHLPRELTDPDWLTAFRPLPSPVDIDYWRVLIQVPQPPETTEGGIVIPEEYRDTKEYMAFIGYVSAIGPLAFKAKTRSQLDMSQAKKFEVGDWVQFGKHSGQKFRTDDGTLWIVMADTDVFGKIDPTRYGCLSY